MPIESRLELRLSQKLILTPQLQQAIKLLQLPHLELSQFLNQELLENPLLEESFDEILVDELNTEEKEALEIQEINEDTEASLEKLMTFTIDDYFEERGSDGRDLGYFNPGLVEYPSFEQSLSKEPDLYDHLLWQLRLSGAPALIKHVGEIIIGNIDENGYLTASLEEIGKIAKVQTAIVEEALKLVQGFDPPGIGAKDLKECLLLQINALNLEGTIVEKIIKNNLEELGKKKYSQIAAYYNISIDDVMTAVKIIEKLDPKPGSIFSKINRNYIVPDVYVIKIADGYQIILNDEGVPRLRICNSYKRLLKQNNFFSKEDKKFFIEKLRSAVSLLKSLDQRNRTIYRVTETLLDIQREFFDKGVEYLKPLTLREVASALNLHESTVSRVTSNKYLSCSHGIFSFRFLFSSALNGNVGNVSSTSVKNLIKKIISEEDPQKPLSDQLIADKLKKEGITIARRTVAKYREKLKIPSQSQRKKLNN